MADMFDYLDARNLLKGKFVFMLGDSSNCYTLFRFIIQPWSMIMSISDLLIGIENMSMLH